MTVILCNISALEYWRCPPIIRDAEISPSAFKHCDERSDEFLSLVKPRANAREAERLIAGRLFTDLKSLSLPIDVMVDDSATRNDHRFLRLHRIPSALNRSSVIPIGGGLSVLSPEAALTLCSPSLSKLRLAQLACEFCGIYSCAPQTTRTDIVLDELLSTHELERMAHRTHKTLPDFMTPRSSAPWVPSIPKSGQPATLWRRAPFFSSDELASFLIVNSRLRGSKKLASTMPLVRDGLASPLEAKVLIMMCAHRASGGYGLPFPQINKPIAMSVAASSLYSVKQVYADFLWPESKTILEVDGKAFHADERGFLIQSGRTASLQSMGYRVHNINYQQLADFDQFIAIMDAVAFDLDILPPNKTGSFYRPSRRATKIGASARSLRELISQTDHLPLNQTRTRHAPSMSTFGEAAQHPFGIGFEPRTKSKPRLVLVLDEPPIRTHVESSKTAGRNSSNPWSTWAERTNQYQTGFRLRMHAKPIPNGSWHESKPLPLNGSPPKGPLSPSASYGQPSAQ